MGQIRDRFRRTPTAESRLCVALGFVPILWWIKEADPADKVEPLVSGVMVIIVFAIGAAGLSFRRDWPGWRSFEGVTVGMFIGWNVIGGLRFLVAALIVLFTAYLLQTPTLSPAELGRGDRLDNLGRSQ